MAATASSTPALRIWLMAARVRTLPAAVAPVLVGTSLAIARGVFRPGAFVAALLGSLLIQIGTNLANDYSDARRGADSRGPPRPGPRDRRRARAAAPGAHRDVRDVRPGRRSAGCTSSSSPGSSCCSSASRRSPPACSTRAGPKPYGYEGLGEVFVFLFFGIAAVTGSTFAQIESWPWEAFVLAVPVGLLAAAILVVNNVRDMDSDKRAGKRTLAVRLGRERARTLYGLMVYGAYLVAPLPWLLGPLSPWLLLPWLTLPLAVRLVRTVRTHADGPTLNEALAQTGMLQLAFCLLLSAGVLAS